MDDVDYSGLIKNILLKADFTVPITNTDLVLRIKFEQEGCLSVFHPTNQVYISYTTDAKWDDISRWYWQNSHVLYRGVMNEIRSLLQEYGIGVRLIDLGNLGGMKVDSNTIIIVRLEMHLYDPQFVLPEPETEGGYESWMM